MSSFLNMCVLRKVRIGFSAMQNVAMLLPLCCSLLVLSQMAMPAQENDFVNVPSRYKAAVEKRESVIMAANKECDEVLYSILASMDLSAVDVPPLGRDPKRSESELYAARNQFNSEAAEIRSFMSKAKNKRIALPINRIDRLFALYKAVGRNVGGDIPPRVPASSDEGTRIKDGQMRAVLPDGQVVEK